MSDDKKMKRFIPLSKLSKQKQKEYHASKRGSWGDVNPVTRKPPDPKVYKRERVIRIEEDS